MTSRTDSGSSLSPKAVDPTTSQNKIVTVLRAVDTDRAYGSPRTEVEGSRDRRFGPSRPRCRAKHDIRCHSSERNGDALGTSACVGDTVTPPCHGSGRAAPRPEPPALPLGSGLLPLEADDRTWTRPSTRYRAAFVCLFSRPLRWRRISWPKAEGSMPA